MTTRPLPPHGTTARAKGRPETGVPGCTCQPCLDAQHRYQKHRTYLQATGRPRTINAEPIAQHLERLFVNGANWRSLCAATGTSPSTISDLRRRTQKTIRRDVAERILAIQPGQAHSPDGRIPITGTQRRVQALYAIGHGPEAIAAATGLRRTTIGRIVNESYDSVTRHVAEAVAASFRQLANTRGNYPRSRTRAERNGWAPPAAWDDIDDPNEQPDWTGHCGTNRGWLLHDTQNIPPCPRCQAAHTKQLGRRRTTAAAPEGAAA